MAVGAVAGTKIYIGTPALSPQVWVEIKDVKDIGALGVSFAKIAREQVGSGYTKQIKGTASAPAFPLVLNRDDTNAGQIALHAAALARNILYPFKLVENDVPSALTSTVTISIAIPGVITWTAHGLAAGNQVVFTTTGTLPTGLTAGTTYYVKTVLTADTFTVAATASGTAITTSGTPSGTHTATSVAAATTATFSGEVFDSTDQYGGVNAMKMVNSSIEVDPETLVYVTAAAAS